MKVSKTMKTSSKMEKYKITACIVYSQQKFMTPHLTAKSASDINQEMLSAVLGIAYTNMCMSTRENSLRKTVFYRRQPSMEDNLCYNITFHERHLLMARPHHFLTVQFFHMITD